MLEALRAQLSGAYRVDRELGGGGMSRAFLAEEVALGRPVVLKVLPPELASVVNAARFEREIRVAARLQHPHIVPVLSAGHSGDALFYTMPLVEGESLRARLDRQAELPVGEAIRLLREVADALAYAHREGVVHRDIKPDNILLSHGHAMVTDFGVARALSEAVGGGTLTGTGMAVGTPAYMAPEQASGDARVDHRADLYALGIVAYEMLAGEPPFRGATFQALVAAQLTQTPTPVAAARPAVPAALAAVVHRCLEKRPADRFQDAGELVAALDRAAPSGELPAAPAAAPPAAISRRVLLAGAAAGLLGAGYWAGSRTGRGGAARTNPTFQRLTFRRGMIRTARFAPDQRTVLYGALWDGDVARVYTVRPESPESAPLALPGALPLAVSSAGELALALGAHYRGVMTYGTLAQVPLAGGAPRELAEDVKFADWSPDGRDLLLVRRVGDRDVIEFPAGTVIAEPEAPGGGFSFARLSRDGESIAAFELDVRDWLTGRVVILDRTGARRTVSERYFNVFGLAWRDDEVWFTAADALPLFRNAVHAMRADGRVRIVARVPDNTTLHDLAADGRALIARTDDRSGIAVRLPGSVRERDLSWLDSSNLTDISRDGSRILFDERGVGGGPRSSAYLRGTDGSPAVRLGDGASVALSPDGRWALVRTVEGSAHLDLVPTGAGTPARLERAGLRLLDARWLADGTRVVARASAEGGAPRLHLLSIDGATTRALTPEGLSVAAPGWALAPDDAAVAVSTGDGVVRFPVARGSARPVPGTTARTTVVGWITGGILVSEEGADGGELVRVDPTSGRRQAWATLSPQDPAGIMSLRLSTFVTTPDGRAYGYTWHRATSDLYLVDGWA